MSVRRCQAEIDAEEFAEWQAFHSVEPFGDWWRAVGDVCAVVLNAVGNIWGKSSRWWFAEDWMPGQAEAAEEKRRRMAGGMEGTMQDVEWSRRERQ